MLTLRSAGEGKCTQHPHHHLGWAGEPEATLKTGASAAAHPGGGNGAAVSPPVLCHTLVRPSPCRLAVLQPSGQPKVGDADIKYQLGKANISPRSSSSKYIKHLTALWMERARMPTPWPQLCNQRTKGCRILAEQTERSWLKDQGIWAVHLTLMGSSACSDEENGHRLNPNGLQQGGA